MRVLQFDRFGPPSVLQMVECPDPTPQAGEVAVKMQASAINPSDVKNVSGHFNAPLPRVPGRDYAGIVVAGDGREGEEVWGSGPGFGVARDGAHAEYIVLPSSWLTRKPKGLPFAQAASIGVPFLVAWVALNDAARLQAGETLLITGAGGAVGHAATQIARARGARAIGANTSHENPSGADEVIDTTHEPLAEEVMRLTNGRGADVVLDAVGGELFEPALRSLAKDGRQIAIASSPKVVSFDLVDFYHGLKRLIGVDSMALNGEEIAAVFERLAPEFERGTLQPPNIRTWPFDETVAAYEAVERHDPPTKHVLTF